jgi:hypothetical protein
MSTIAKSVRCWIAQRDDLATGPEGLQMTAGYTPQQSFIASESRQLADADLTQGDQHAEEDHFAHVTGKTCKSCGRPIEAGQAARRRGETEWAHDVCPVVTD